VTLWRAAEGRDVKRLWPAARSAGVAANLAEFAALASAAPWRVRASERGDGCVLQPWRAHLSILSLRAVWCAAPRLASLVHDAAEVAAGHGFSELLSPLVTERQFEPYAAAGLGVRESVVALQAALGRGVRGRATAKPVALLRDAAPRDAVRLAEIDAVCFDDFWRYGVPELESVMAAERAVVAEDGGVPVGYATVGLHGSSATLGRLAVAPDARRAGIGALLVADALDWARATGALGLSVCTQESNEAALGLYRTTGFAEIAEGYVLGSCPVASARTSGERIH
jgi:ribosomal-protein-alanine N-acetyltransferase